MRLFLTVMWQRCVQSLHACEAQTENYTWATFSSSSLLELPLGTGNFIIKFCVDTTNSLGAIIDWLSHSFAIL